MPLLGVLTTGSLVSFRGAYGGLPDCDSPHDAPSSCLLHGTAFRGAELGSNWAGVNSFFAHALPTAGPSIAYGGLASDEQALPRQLCKVHGTARLPRQRGGWKSAHQVGWCASGSVAQGSRPAGSTNLHCGD